jgi:GNAT superfamily N-acetyltransferase
MISICLLAGAEDRIEAGPNQSRLVEEAISWSFRLEPNTVPIMKKSTTKGLDLKSDLASRTKQGSQPTPRLSVRKLGSQTWPDFERVVEKHNGIWGGCWCVAFHLKRSEEKQWSGKHKTLKEKLVRANRSHAALVYDGADVVGWCQFGPRAELPARMSGFNRLGEAPPDWRITCFFVDRDHRKEGVSKAALEGALQIIASKGGGTVDGYPIDTRGKPYSSSFLWGGTETMFTELGFRKLGALGSSKWVMRKDIRSQ